MKIILVGIYRKESIIISRLIQSCKSIIDGFVCSNTENTEDDMSNEIIRVCNELKLPFKISYNEWVNFGVNRTISYKVFQEFIKEKNWDPATTYALLLDADMCLNIKPTFNKNKLKEAMYQVIQKNPSIEYYNVRLIRGDVPAICISVTHEYWGQDESNGWKSLPVGQLEDLEILDYNDGQYKGMKFDRDIKLLTQGLIDEPGNVRYMFYLGQS